MIERADRVTRSPEQEAAYCEIEMAVRARRFAQPALRATLGPRPQGQFLDDFLWNFSGDPVRVDHMMPKKPGCGDELYDYPYDYCRTLVNGYTGATLINVRTTPDPQASPFDRYLVVIGDMERETVSRLRVNGIERPEGSHMQDKWLRLIITLDKFDVLDGEPKVEDDDLMQLNQQVLDQSARHEQQAHIQLSSQGITLKPFDGRGQMIRGIDGVVRDRHTLSRLAITAGIRRPDQSEVVMPQSYLLDRRAA